MAVLIGIIKVVCLLGFLVFIHEGGHFVLAKACKVFVKEFSIGFGPKIISWQGKETKYSIRVIPFGGYVSMLGEDEKSEEEGSFCKASVLKRFMIVSAGAVVNIVFGLVVFFILISISGNNPSNVIESFSEEYTVASKELQVGDIILEVNGKKIHIKSDLDNAIAKSNGDSIFMRVRRGSEVIERNFVPNTIESKTIGTYFSATTLEPKIKYLEEGSSCKEKGMKVGDVITKINDTEITEYTQISKVINSSELDIIKVEVRRNLQTIEFEVEPEIYKTYVLGVYLKKAENNFVNNTYYGFWETVDFIRNIFNSVKKIFTGNINMEQMTGPIGISEMVIETNGIYNFVYLMSLISVSLGITNLLPIPALDGGKLLFLIIEAIRRKPLREELELQIQMIGFTILILFSLYVSYRDILKIL